MLLHQMPKYTCKDNSNNKYSVLSASREESLPHPLQIGHSPPGGKGGGSQINMAGMIVEIVEKHP